MAGIAEPGESVTAARCEVSLSWLSSWYSPYIRVPAVTFSSAPTTVVDCSAPAVVLKRSFA